MISLKVALNSGHLVRLSGPAIDLHQSAVRRSGRLLLGDFALGQVDVLNIHAVFTMIWPSV